MLTLGEDALFTVFHRLIRRRATDTFDPKTWGFIGGSKGGGDPLFLMLLRNTGIGQLNNNGLGSVMIDPKNDAFF